MKPLLDHKMALLLMTLFVTFYGDFVDGALGHSPSASPGRHHPLSNNHICPRDEPEIMEGLSQLKTDAAIFAKKKFTGPDKDTLVQKMHKIIVEYTIKYLMAKDLDKFKASCV
jgi:hypothetical protein